MISETLVRFWAKRALERHQNMQQGCAAMSMQNIAPVVEENQALYWDPETIPVIGSNAFGSSNEWDH